MEVIEIESKLDYKILATGSSGNCVIIGDVMIDCGIAYSKIKEHLYDIRYLLLTHVHTDHVKKSAYTRLRKEFPHIQVIGNYEIHQTVGVDTISNNGLEIETDHYTFKVFDCVHDVVTHGFTWQHKGHNLIYATDTASLEHAPVEKYDYMFLEANYDPVKLEQVRGKSHGQYKPYLSAMRHMNKKDTELFYYMNRRSKDSVLVELHQSGRFY